VYPPGTNCGNYETRSDWSSGCSGTGTLCGGGDDKTRIFCTAPVQSTQYNDCSWLVTSGDDCMNTDANAQWCREHNRDRCPRQCPH
jgi:hypothetical protein